MEKALLAALLLLSKTEHELSLSPLEMRPKQSASIKWPISKLGTLGD